MQKLIKGIHTFQTKVFHSKRVLFQRLATDQRPMALFITCSDSRIDPNLLTQTEPGEIFVLRNAGNIIPPAPYDGGEIATIEFAVTGLGIQDIVVCGHSDCGAVKGLINPRNVEVSMPSMHHWLRHAKRTEKIIERQSKQLQGGQLLAASVEENVVVQIENLRTHDFVERRLAEGTLRIHGWVYKFETGDVFSYDAEREQFRALISHENPRPSHPRLEKPSSLDKGSA